MASVHKPSNLFPPGYQFAVPVLVLFPLGLPSDLGPYGGAVGVPGPVGRLAARPPSLQASLRKVRAEADV